MRGHLLIALCAAGCAAEPTATIESEASACPDYGADTYQPFAAPGHYVKSSVASAPWRGPTTAYPNGDENFSGYSAPEMVECSSDKSARPYLDVTDGCLAALHARGQVQATPEGYFRVVALGFSPDQPDLPVKWTDQSVSYRFYYSAQTGDAGNPGFKAFARYRTEDDLYVASWRADGVVQIQKKECGIYTALVLDKDFGPPSPGVWHTLRFDAIGDALALSLDGHSVISTTNSSFTWGTAGIRIDGMDGAYLEDWRVD